MFREIAGEYGSKSLYRNLGYFSLICLLRVHVLLGDPTCECLDGRVDGELTDSGPTNDGARRAQRRRLPYTYYRLSRHDLLPRRLRIHVIGQVAGRHQNVHLGLDLLCADEAVPHKKLSVWFGKSHHILDTFDSY